MADMEVRCTVCDRQEAVGHGHALEHGWPRCCGYTMRLESTKFVAAVEAHGIPHLARGTQS